VDPMGNAYEIYALRYATMSPRTPHMNYLLPDPHETTAQDLDYFVWLIRGHGRDILVDTGFNAEEAYLSIAAIKRGYIEGGLYAASATLLVALLTLKRLKDALLATLPVLGGMLWTAGMMWLFHQQFNLANLVVVPITIGIGIESGLYLVQRARKEGHEGWQVVGGSTGQSVAVFSLSTMVGFASLLVSRHYGIFSMGLLLVLAVSCVLALSLTVLPLLLKSEESPVGERNGAKTIDS